MSDDAFLEVLAGCTDACAGMDLSDDGWKPVDGEYDVMLEDVTVGTKEGEGITNAWVKPTFTVVDGEFKGRSFSDYFWIAGGMVEPSISVKNLCRLATCLAETEVKNPIEAAEICKAAVSEFLTVEIYRTVAKKGKNKGKVYANVRFLQRLEAIEAPNDGALDVDASVAE